MAAFNASASFVPGDCDELFVDLASLPGSTLSQYARLAADFADPQGAPTVGVYLSRLSAEHLQDLLSDGTQAQGQDTVALTNLSVLTIVLCNAEGLPVTSGPDLCSRTQSLLLLAQIEHCRREGKISLKPTSVSLESLEGTGIRLTREGQALYLRQDSSGNG